MHLARAPGAAVQLKLQIAVALTYHVHGGQRLFTERSPPQIGMDYYTGGINYRAQAGLIQSLHLGEYSRHYLIN